VLQRLGHAAAYRQADEQDRHPDDRAGKRNSGSSGDDLAGELANQQQSEGLNHFDVSET
jgi:hypothetical protein